MGAALLNTSNTNAQINSGANWTQPINININSPTIMRASAIDWFMEQVNKNLKLKGVATA